MWFIIGFLAASYWCFYCIRYEIEKYGYFRLNGKYYYPEDEIRK